MQQTVTLSAERFVLISQHWWCCDLKLGSIGVVTVMRQNYSYLSLSFIHSLCLAVSSPHSSITVTVILRLIRYFLKLLGTAYNCVKVIDISHQIPVTLTSIEHIAILENQSFIEYVVCPRCSVIYEFRDCIRMLPNGKNESKTCRHIAYPNHPPRSKRTTCGALLLK